MESEDSKVEGLKDSMWTCKDYNTQFVNCFFVSGALRLEASVGALGRKTIQSAVAMSKAGGCHNRLG